MKLDHIALDRLSISPANMRGGKKPPDITAILPSIRARGIIMPLLVRPNGSAETFASSPRKRWPEKPAVPSRCRARSWRRATMPPRWRPR
jgi:hypothetical protein